MKSKLHDKPSQRMKRKASQDDICKTKRRK